MIQNENRYFCKLFAFLHCILDDHIWGSGMKEVYNYPKTLVYNVRQGNFHFNESTKNKEITVVVY